MPSTMGPESRRIRAKIARTIQRDQQADVTDLRREFATARIADHIKRVVDAAPPLTPEQRDRLALLLRGGDSDV